MNNLLERVSETPRLWNVLRRLVEDNFKGERQVIAEELSPWHDVGQRRFLDFGCGTGEFASSFPPDHYVGIDISATYIHFAARTYPGHFLVSSVEHMALASQQFDAALVLGILHHLPDVLVQVSMRELHRMLRPGATVLVMEDIPPPDMWNIAGHAMHWLDRGGYIRNEVSYRSLFGEGFQVRRTYHMRSGICDYGVYVLRRR